ncbi:hypothetical protein ABXN37_13035 [Piscinibacter sakaiensis]
MAKTPSQDIPSAGAAGRDLSDEEFVEPTNCSPPPRPRWTRSTR